MRKRERENPCLVCGHYHKYEESEVCGICGHRMPATSEKSYGAFPSEILPDFLYLGSYDNASRFELLKAQGISRILNTVPSCQNLYRNSFVYHSLQDDKSLPFDDAIHFLGDLYWQNNVKEEKARVLVHCMTGKSRFVTGYSDWLLDEVRRMEPCAVTSGLKSRDCLLILFKVSLYPGLYSVDLVQASIQEYEQQLFRSMELLGRILRIRVRKDDAAAVPTFNTGTRTLF
ncbi:LOW QUALITY PROTEIN: hypothetical protein Cgig2_026416 [Carnegiea gigantea]|uniref:Uncharacterized protein n=1 Tax=Carnegiea gigantea TaxID=171969 RepID=A0A9Q1GPQ5_9CARY|nr:LOW QUALITY PROTEIN: hypothetical protein Cgig2_026416 [Carnegiea gigantea]